MLRLRVAVILIILGLFFTRDDVRAQQLSERLVRLQASASKYVNDYQNYGRAYNEYMKIYSRCKVGATQCSSYESALALTNYYFRLVGSDLQSFEALKKLTIEQITAERKTCYDQRFKMCDIMSLNYNPNSCVNISARARSLDDELAKAYQININRY